MMGVFIFLLGGDFGGFSCSFKVISDATWIPTDTWEVFTALRRTNEWNI